MIYFMGGNPFFFKNYGKRRKILECSTNFYLINSTLSILWSFYRSFLISDMALMLHCTLYYTILPLPKYTFLKLMAPSCSIIGREETYSDNLQCFCFTLILVQHVLCFICYVLQSPWQPGLLLVFFWLCVVGILFIVCSAMWSSQLALSCNINNFQSTKLSWDNVCCDWILYK